MKVSYPELTGSKTKQFRVIFRLLASLCTLLVISDAAAALAQLPGFPLVGSYRLAVDAGGARNSSYTLSVDQPGVGSTIHSAYLFAATYGGLEISNGDITLDGSPVTFTSSTGAQSDEYFNYVADVTSIVSGAFTASSLTATSGLSFTVNELITDTNSEGIDGTVLAVIFDDPTVDGDQTIMLLTGAQAAGTDSFTVTYPSAIPPNGTADFGVGISHSFQNGSTNQYSRIDINSTRLSTSAGGQDDGTTEIGALITAGGYGDSNENPTDPTELPDGFAGIDDESYSLLPIVASTVTASTPVRVTTVNPSTNDNLFVAWFVFSAEPVLGENIILTPNQATNTVGTTHTVTATVVDDNGDPASGKFVFFEVISGPNSGEASTLVTTNSSGQVSWTYTDTSEAGGTDQIQASFLNSEDELQVSNTAIKIWVEGTVQDSQFVSLEPGWNLVFIRVDAFEGNPAVLFGSGSSVYRLVKTKADGSAFAYTYTYELVSGEDALVGGQTYWIYEPGTVSRTVQVDGATNGVTQVALGRAWNTVGTHNRTTVAAALGFLAVYYWDASANAYVAASVDPTTGRTTLEAEVGYFVYGSRPVSFAIRP